MRRNNKKEPDESRDIKPHTIKQVHSLTLCSMMRISSTNMLMCSLDHVPNDAEIMEPNDSIHFNIDYYQLLSYIFK